MFGFFNLNRIYRSQDRHQIAQLVAQMIRVLYVHRKRSVDARGQHRVPSTHQYHRQIHVQGICRYHHLHIAAKSMAEMVQVCHRHRQRCCQAPAIIANSGRLVQPLVTKKNGVLKMTSGKATIQINNCVIVFTPLDVVKHSMNLHMRHYQISIHYRRACWKAREPHLWIMLG